MKISNKSVGIIALLVIRSSFLVAQSNRFMIDKTTGSYFSLTMGIGNALGIHRWGILAASFPYTVYDASGNATQKQFNTSHSGMYGKAEDVGQCNYITFEAGNRDMFANYKFSGNNMVDTRLVSGGRIVQLNESLNAKISLGIAFSEPWRFSVSSTGYDSLGSIDNRNVTLQILGRTFYPSFKNNSGQNEDANQLSVYYKQSNISLVPRISFGRNEYRHFFYFDVFLEYYLPVTKLSSLNFLQNNDSSTHEVFIPHRGYVTYNGLSNSHVPAVFHGLYAGFTLGLSFSQKDRFIEHSKIKSPKRVRPQRHVKRIKRKPKKSKTKTVSKKRKPKIAPKKPRVQDNSRGW